MSNNIFQIHQENNPAKQTTVKNTAAEKLKIPEYSVDKTAKKPAEHPASTPKKR